jgi:hypothetical protein
MHASSRIGLVVALSGAAIAFLSSSAAAPVTTAPTTSPTVQPSPKLPPAVITDFARVIPGAGAGQMASLAYTNGPLHYRVQVKNLSGTQLSTSVLVSRKRGGARIGSFAVDIPKGETRAFTFSDVEGLVDGCNPVRYELAVEDGATRIGQAKPSCKFEFTRSGTSAGPQGTMPANPACNQPWNLSATVKPPAKSPFGQPSPSGVLRLHDPVRKIVAGSASVPAQTADSVVATILSPFDGGPGSYVLEYEVPSYYGGAAYGGGPSIGSKHEVTRTCTVDLGRLE